MSDEDEASVTVTGTTTTATADEAWLAELGEQARDWYFIALSLQEDGRLSMAAALLIRASCLEPDSSQLREVGARAQFRARQYLGAHATFSGMLALAPRDDFARYAGAICAACLGWLDEALTNVREAVRRRPEAVRYRRALEVIQQIVDELDGAEPVQMPSYLVPPVAIDPRLLSLELGPRPAAPERLP